MERFDIQCFIGKGGFASVYHAHDLQFTSTASINSKRRDVALKIVDVKECRRRRRNRQNGHTTKDAVNSDEEEDGAASTTEEEEEEDFNNDSLSSSFKSHHNKNNKSSILSVLKREKKVHTSLSSLQHSNIVALYAAFYISPKQHMVFVLEYCSLGDLQSFMKRRYNEKKKQKEKKGILLMSEEEAQHGLSHVLRGLAFLHSRGIVHRDIKAGNVFLSPSSSSFSPSSNEKGEKEEKFSLLDCTLKIGDFGLAVQMRDDDDWDEAQHTLCGTPNCLAPEVVLSSNDSSSCYHPRQQQQQQQQQENEDYDFYNNHGKRMHLVGDYEQDSLLDDTLFYNDGCRGYKQDSIMMMMQKQQEQHQICNKDGDEPPRGHGQPADLWSTGCLFYAMLFGKYPFAPSSQQQKTINRDERIQFTIQSILKGEWSIPSSALEEENNDVVSQEAVFLLQQLLHPNGKKRGMARGILSSHAFFRKQFGCSSSKNIPTLRKKKDDGSSASLSKVVHNVTLSSIKKPILPPRLTSCPPKQQSTLNVSNDTKLIRESYTFEGGNMKMPSSISNASDASRHECSNQYHHSYNLSSSNKQEQMEVVNRERIEKQTVSQQQQQQERTSMSLIRPADYPPRRSVTRATTTVKQFNDGDGFKTACLEPKHSSCNIHSNISAPPSTATLPLKQTKNVYYNDKDSKTAYLVNKEMKQDQNNTQQNKEKDDEEAFEGKNLIKEGGAKEAISSQREDKQRYSTDTPHCNNEVGKKASAAAHAASVSMIINHHPNFSQSKSAEELASKERNDLSQDHTIEVTKGSGNSNTRVPQNSLLRHPNRDIIQSFQHLQNDDYEDDDDITSAADILDPIEAMSRLTPLKHHWKEVKRKSSNSEKQETTSTKSLFYTVFILPGGKGAVIQCEDKHGKGLWMHVTGDGLRVCVGKLCQTSNFSVHDSKPNRQFASLFDEAFSRAPIHVQQQPPAVASLLSNQNVSLTASAMPGMIPSLASSSNTISNASFLTAFGSGSIQTLPLYTSGTVNGCQAGNGRVKASFKPLSSLLQSKHKSHLQIYKKLEGVIFSVKRKTPKITLYVHSPKERRKSCKMIEKSNLETNQSAAKENSISLGGLMAKTMLMENSPLPDVETIFVDGVAVRYQMRSGNTKLMLPKEQGGASYLVDLSVTECARNAIGGSLRMKKSAAQKYSSNSCPDENDLVKRRFANHISFAQTATEECLQMERWYESTTTTRRLYSRNNTGVQLPYPLTTCSKGNNTEIFPIVRKIIARGTCRDDWVAVDK